MYAQSKLLSACKSTITRRACELNNVAFVAEKMFIQRACGFLFGFLTATLAVELLAKKETF